jgi:hypothetical protein
MSEFAAPREIGVGGKVIYGTEKGLLVRFYAKPILMEAISKEQGYPYYEDRVFINIVSPGNTKTVWDMLAKGIQPKYKPIEGAENEYEQDGWEIEELEGEADPIKYPEAWGLFIKKGEKAHKGWDIAEWGAITRSFAESLKALNIPTVEALAGLSDSAASNIMGGRKFRDLAKAALEEQELLSLASAEQEKASKAEEEVKSLKKQIEGMQAQINSMAKKKDAA